MYVLSSGNEIHISYGEYINNTDEKKERTMQNINVINNAGNNVNVTINEKDTGIQILIDTVHND